MASGNEKATLGIDLEGNAAQAAKSAADALQQLRDRIAAGQGALRGMNGTLKNLTGATDEVKAAQTDLKAAIDAEKAAVTSATLEMLKQQKAYASAGGDAKALAAKKNALSDKVKTETAGHKKLGDELKKTGTDAAAAKTKALGAAISTAGGPVAGLRDKLSTLKDVLGEGGAGGASSLLTLGLAGLAAAAVALVAGVAAAAYSLGKFVIKAADAARSASLLREAAFGGNAQWGKNFGEQIDALSKKVPTSKAELDKLGVSLARSKIGGQAWVDTLNAVAQANAALPGAGDQLKEFITRGQQFNRFQLNPQELKGTGIEFQEVAAQLAKSMRIGVKDAQAALFEGRVKLGDGAAAMRAAVEAKFGKINLRQMLSLETLAMKLGETFDELVKGVDLEPMLKAFKELFETFSLSTTSGQALKQLVTIFGNDLVGSIASGTPLARKFIYGLIMGAQDLTIAYLKVRNYIRDAFGGTSLASVANLNTALTIGKYTILAIAGVAALLGVALAAVSAPFVAIIAGAVLIPAALDGVGKSIREWFKGVDWSASGRAIIDGLVEGLKNGAGLLKDAILGLANGVKDTFAGALKIHSPSKVFEEYGENTTAGYAKGVDGSAGTAQSSVNSMVATPTGGGRGGGAATYNITINATGGDAKQIGAALSSQSFLEQLTAAVSGAAMAGGVAGPA